jgi:hypothetical protein
VTLAGSVEDEVYCIVTLRREANGGGSFLQNELVAARDAQAIADASVLDPDLAAVAEELAGIEDGRQVALGRRGRVGRVLAFGHDNLPSEQKEKWR